MGDCTKIHIVTAGYLRRFTDDKGLIQPVKLGGSPQRPIRPRRPETVGYRPYFFANRKIAKDTERKLSQWENRGLQALARISSTWPVEDDARFRDRIDIAGLVAVHMVRNPAFRSHTAHLQNQKMAELAIPDHFAETDYEEKLLRHFTSEEFTIPHMMGMIPKMASLIASAHWTLIDFTEPLLATSDQPVSAVPILPEGMQATVEPQPSGGYIYTEEFRFPIDPRHALLFTWANEPDTPEPLHGTSDLAADFNRMTIACADRDWFHDPTRRPTRLPATGVPTTECFPVARSLLPNYGPEAAAESRRRLDAARCLDEMIEHDVTDRFHVARVAV